MASSQPLHPSTSNAPSLNPSTTVLPDSGQPAHSVPSPVNMNNNGTARNGQLKRHKRESRKRREAKGTEASDGPREKKAAAAASSAIPSSELFMLMPMLLTDPRPTDVLHPKPRQLNLAFEKHSDVVGQSWEFYEIADKCAPSLALKAYSC